MAETDDEQTSQAEPSEQSDLDLDGMVQNTFRVPAALMDAYRQRAAFHQVQLGDLIAYAFFRLWQVEGEGRDWSAEQLGRWAAEVQEWSERPESVADWVDTWRKPRHSGRLGITSATERRRLRQEGRDDEGADEA